MDNKHTIKKQRALMFLRLREDHNVEEVSILLDTPLSTIQKHDNALKRLTGLLGPYKKSRAFLALADVDSGRYQVDSVKNLTDHKMVSDLVAMRWAILKRCDEMEKAEQDQEERDALAIAKAKKIFVDSSVIELRIRNKFRGPIDTVTGAMDTVLAIACIDESPEYQTALSELTEAVIELEETLMS